MHVVTYTLSSLSRRIRCCTRRCPERRRCRARTAARTPAHTCSRLSCACNPGSTRSLSALSRSSERGKKRILLAVLLISGMFIPDPGSEFFPFRIRIFFISEPGFATKDLSILTQKNLSKLSETLSGLFILIPDPDFLPIPDPGSRGLKGSGSRIPDPQHCLLPLSVGQEQCSARLRYFQMTRKIPHSG
jgi:hypothetical protein